MQNDEFEWDDDKAELNLEKHGIAFLTAIEIFGDPFIESIADLRNSNDEARFLSIGNTRAHRTIVVAHSQRGSRTRIIQAKRLRRKGEDS